MAKRLPRNLLAVYLNDHVNVKDTGAWWHPSGVLLLSGLPTVPVKRTDVHGFGGKEVDHFADSSFANHHFIDVVCQWSRET